MCFRLPLSPPPPYTLGVFLQQDRVLSHQGMAHEPTQDPQSGQRSRVRHDSGQGSAGDQDRLGESAHEADEADPDPEADQETPSAHPAPREVEAAEEDEDSAEIRRETEDDQGDDEDQKARMVTGARRHDVVDVQAMAIVN